MLDRVRECLRLLSYMLLVNITSGKVCLLLQDADSWATSSPSAQLAGHMLGPQLAHGNVTGMASTSNTMKMKCRTCRCVCFIFADVLPFIVSVSAWSRREQDGVQQTVKTVTTSQSLRASAWHTVIKQVICNGTQDHTSLEIKKNSSSKV